MIECPNCGRQFAIASFPIYCDCGEVTREDNSNVCQSESIQQAQQNLWRTIHSRLAAAIKSGQWNPSAEIEHYQKTWLPAIPSYNCDCRSHWNNLVEQMPIDWTSAESAFESFVLLHNQVSIQHSHKPAYSIDQARFIWLDETPKRDRCIVTIATGSKYSKLLDVSRPSIIAYAERCNADYYELTDKTEADWKIEKFRVHGFASRYERTLFLDADILIRSNCRDLFDFVPIGSIGIHDDFECLRSTAWLTENRKPVFDSQGIVAKPNRRSCLNTGVVLCDRKDADIWEKPAKPLPALHCAEQFIIEERCFSRRKKICKIPTELNAQWWMQDFEDRLPAAEIIHLANCPYRLKLMRELAK